MTDQGFVDLLASFSDLDLNKCINNQVLTSSQD